MFKWHRALCCLLALLVCFYSVGVPALAYNTDTDDIINFLDSEGNIAFTIPASEFVLEDYVIPYEDYLYYMNNPISTFSTTSGEGLLGFEGLAWSAAFSSLGLVCKSGAMYILGYLVLGGSAVFGAHGIVKTLWEQGPVVFYDAISNIMLHCSEDTYLWLAEAFDMYCAGEDIVIPVSVSQDIASVLNGQVFQDSGGNWADSSISVNSSILGGVLETLPSNIPFNSTDKTEPLLINFTDVKPHEETYSVGGLTISTIYEGNKSTDDNRLTITNDKTGASLTMPWDQFNYNRGQLARLSKFYKIDFGTYSYWTLYGQYFYGTQSSPYTPDKHTQYADNYIRFENTNTILDGLIIGGVVYNTATSMWRYIIGECSSTTDLTTAEAVEYPTAPIDIILSNTGVGVISTPMYYPNEEEKTPVLPFNPPKADVNNPAIGIPTTDSYADNIAESNTATDTPSTDVDKPSGILSGIIDWIKEGVLNALKAAFVPRESFFSDFFKGLEDSFSNRFGILTYPVSVIYNFFDSFLDVGNVAPILRWNSWSYEGTVVIPAGSYNLNDMLENDTVKKIHDIYLIIIDCCLVFMFLRLIEKKYHSVISN